MLKENIESLARNTSVMFVQQIITWSSTFILMLFMPRFLGPVSYGQLFVASSITQIFSIFVAYGGNYIIAKNVSRSREMTPQILVDAIGLRFFFGIIAFICVLILASVIGYSGELKVILIIFSLGFFWGGGIAGFYAAYQGHERMKYTSAAAIVERLFLCIVGVTALFLGANAVVIAIISIIGSLLNFTILVAFSRRIVSYLPSIRWRSLWGQTKEGLPYFLMGTFSMLYFRIDSIMLSKMTPEPVVGWYGTAYRLFETMNFIPFIYSTALYPILSRLWVGMGIEHNRTTQKSIGFMFIGGVPISIGVIFFAENIIHMFYGSQMYESSIIVLQILSGGLIFLYVDMILGTTLISSDKQKALSLVSLSAIPVNTILNLFLISHFQQYHNNGGLGSAIATIITEIFIMVIYLNLMPKGFLRGFPIIILVKCIIGGVGMVITFYLLQLLELNWVVQAILLFAVYGFCIVFLKVFERAEQKILIELLSLKKFGLIKS